MARSKRQWRCLEILLSGTSVGCSYSSPLKQEVAKCAKLLCIWIPYIQNILAIRHQSLGGEWNGFYLQIQLSQFAIVIQLSMICTNLLEMSSCLHAIIYIRPMAAILELTKRKFTRPKISTLLFSWCILLSISMVIEKMSELAWYREYLSSSLINKIICETLTLRPPS